VHLASDGLIDVDERRVESAPGKSDRFQLRVIWGADTAAANRPLTGAILMGGVVEEQNFLLALNVEAGAQSPRGLGELPRQVLGGRHGADAPASGAMHHESSSPSCIFAAIMAGRYVMQPSLKASVSVSYE